MLRRLLAPAGFVLAALLCAFLATEGLLRAADIAYPDFFRDDAVIGRSLRPGAYGWWKIEGTAYVEINSDGLRDREHVVEKPPDTVRIAVLGDSMAAAFEVSREATFWAEIERELATCPSLGGRRVEVLNFGLGGAGTAQEFLILQNRVWKYRPDVVLLAFHTGTDVSDNSRMLKGSSRSPYFVHDAQGRLALDPVFVEKRERMSAGPLGELGQAAFNRSRVLQVAAEARRRIRMLTRSDAGVAPPAPGSEVGLDQQIYAPPTRSEWREAWAVTEDLVRAIGADVRGNGAELLVATLSNAIQVHPDVGVRERFAAETGVADLFYPDRRIEALATAEAIPFRMLAPPLGEWAAANETCIHGFDNATPCAGHWNENGHRLAGEALAAAICTDLLAE